MLFETVDSLGSLEAAKVPLVHAVSFVKFSFLFQNQGVSYRETYLTCLDHPYIMSANGWVGGFRKWPFLLTFSTVFIKYEVSLILTWLT